MKINGKSLSKIFLSVVLSIASELSGKAGDTHDVTTLTPLFNYHASPVLQQLSNIPHKRYRATNECKTEFGIYPLWSDDASGCYTLFPAGRADRMYLLIYGASEFSLTGSADQFRCYEYKSGKLRLLYTVPLRSRPLAAPSPVNNLMEYLNDVEFESLTYPNGSVVEEGYVIRGTIPKFVRDDLEKDATYVQYNLNVYTDGLSVTLTSSMGATAEHFTDDGELYNIDEDPVSHKALSQNEFYARYGLPLAKGELRALNR